MMLSLVLIISLYLYIFVLNMFPAVRYARSAGLDKQDMTLIWFTFLATSFAAIAGDMLAMKYVANESTQTWICSAILIIYVNFSTLVVHILRLMAARVSAERS